MKNDRLEVKVTGLAVDQAHSPVVLLKEVAGERTLPIWIGAAEANAIALVLHGMKTERPLTHDLMKTIVKALQVKVTKIVISDLKENTFYAKIFLERDGSIFSIDARPSDSIALALRIEAPIFVAEEVMKSGGTSMKINKSSKAKDWRETLKDLDPEDFGKYKIDDPS
jgi:bifunctional DNase/RNase